MKNLILSAMMIAAIFTSCSKDDSDYEGYGNIAVNVNSDVNLSAVQTRAATTVTDETTLNTYSFTVKRASVANTTWTGNYTYIKSASFAAATDYTISAENCNAATARTANSYYGQKRIYGESSQFAIKAGETTAVTLNCTVANSMVTVTLDNTTLGNYFSSYEVSIGDGTGDGQRMLKFDSSNTTAYFDAGVTLSYSISAKLKNSESTVTFNNTIALGTTENKTEAAKNYNITVKASSSNGKISLTMTVDDSLTDVTVPEVAIDPYATTTTTR